MNDSLRKIALDGIERHCGWLKVSSAEIVHFVKMLEFRRPYLTEAEEAMNQAGLALDEATVNLANAREAYNQLRKES